MTTVHDLPAHPAAELFPLMDGDEFAELSADVAANGLIEPVWLCDDPELGRVVLDGRNRLRACQQADVEPRTRVYEGSDPVGFVIGLNVKRRHLSVGQKASVASRSLALYEAQAAKRKAHGETAPGQAKETLPADLQEASQPRYSRESTSQAAQAVGVSGRAVGQYKRVTEQAPDLAAKVDSGDMALDRAERVVRDRDAEQRKVEQAQQEAAHAGVETTVDIRHGDFRNVLADLTNVDAIITDPPYPQEYLPLLGDLAEWADSVLTDDGVLAVLIGQTHLPEVYRQLGRGRPYRWTGCYYTPGPGYVSWPRKVQSNWKPLLVYGGGPRFADVVTSEGNDADAKHNHQWGQDYAAFHTIIERLTSRGQTVADPFMGSGTTLLAAHALGRHTVGCDTDDESIDTARRRMRHE